jgi:hypothetical protein
MSVTRELRRRLDAQRSLPSFDPCLPRSADQPPAGPGWIHEIKHDGFRILAHQCGRSVRLVTRNGHDLADRFPLAAAAIDGALIYLYLITLGTIAIVVMLKAPRGLWGLIGDGPNIHLFPIQRRVRLGSSSGGTMTSSALREGAALRPNESRLGVTTEK